MPDPSYKEQAKGLLQAIKALLDNRVDDAYCYRALIDNYCAIKVGATRKNGKWATELLRDTKKNKERCFWSKEAIKMKDSGGKVEREHVIPMRAIVEKLRNLDRPTLEEEIDKKLQSLMWFAVVSPSQHKEFNKVKNSKGESLRSAMPDEWNENCPFARYSKTFPTTEETFTWESFFGEEEPNFKKAKWEDFDA